METKVLLKENQLQIVLERLACQIVENHFDLSNTVLLGLQPRGVFLADYLKNILEEKFQIKNIEFGHLDATFFRDDFGRREDPLTPSQTKINFLIENKKVILIDDVLYSGRSVRSTLTALQSFGRPQQVELLVLIDRRFSREFPIQPDYKGKQVDVINTEKVVVKWQNIDGKSEVHLVEK